MVKGRDHREVEGITSARITPLPRLLVSLFGDLLGLVDDTESNIIQSQMVELQSKLPHLSTALTHRSAVLENPKLIDNERLEFLGDSVIEAKVSDALFHQFPTRDEGYLTLVRSTLVNTDALARIALALELDAFVTLGQGERANGGSAKRTILSGAFEAVVASIYLDLSFEAAASFIETTVLAELANLEFAPSLLDPKSQLQILLAKAQLQPPIYKNSKAGPDHMPVFVAQVNLDSSTYFEGIGGSKKEAEQAAARMALAYISNDRPELLM